MRNICASLIFASAFAYLAGALLASVGTSPILNMNPILQIAVFGIMAILSFAASQAYIPNKKLRVFLGIVWGAMAAFTFTGYVIWAPSGDAASRLFMTLWDLALAVCVLDNG